MLSSLPPHVFTLAPPVVALTLLAAITAGCGATDQALDTSTPFASTRGRPISRGTRDVLVPVQLPDLSGSPAPVRRQLEVTYDRLQPITAAADASRDDRGEAMGQMGRLLMAASYYDTAERCFQHALRLQPHDARWRYLLGHVYRLRHEPGRAAEAFAATLRLRADDVAALVWLGNAYLDLGDPVRAEPLFERALVRQPELASALHGLGRVALARREFARAVQRLTAALRVDPRASSIHRSLALAYHGAGDTRRAAAHMRQRGDTDARPPDPQLQAISSLLETSTPGPYGMREVSALERGRADTPDDEFSDGPQHARTTAAFSGR